MTSHDPTPAVVFDAAAFTAWLHSPTEGQPARTWAQAFDLSGHIGDPQDVTELGLLSVLDDLLAAPPGGLELRGDVARLGLWRIPDGDALDQGALVTVDLTSGIRLASRHQDLDDLSPRQLRGAAAVCAAMRSIAELANQLVTGYRQAACSGAACGHRRLVERIWAAMYPPDQQQWSPDTLDQVAALLHDGGHPPRDPPPPG